MGSLLSFPLADNQTGALDPSPTAQTLPRILAHRIMPLLDLGLLVLDPKLQPKGCAMPLLGQLRMAELQHHPAHKGLLRHQQALMRLLGFLMMSLMSLSR